ncbi:MAG: hypothetical protein ACRD88_18600 [Terriglobia bacterium]
MSTPSAAGLKSEAAIQVRVCGNDVQKTHFEELSTAIPTPTGAMLETIHELCEGATLEIFRPSTRRKALATVKSLGPKLGASTLVFVEGLGVEHLWNKESPGPGEREQQDDPAGGASSGDTNHPGPLVPLSDRRHLPSSKLRIPMVDRLMDSLADLVESALEENLRPTVDRLTQEIPEHVAKARGAVFANFEAQMETAVATFGERLDSRSREVIAQNEQLLNRKIQEATEGAQQCLQAKQEEFRQNLEGESRSAKERLKSEVDAAVAQGCAQLQDRLRTEAGSLEQRVAERCRTLAEETEKALGSRAKQVEAEFVDRLSQQVHRVLDGFSEALEKRVNQALALPMQALDHRLEETAKALSGRAQQVERDFAERLDRQADELARRYHEQLQESLQQKFLDQQAQFQEQLAANAGLFRSRFKVQLEDELNAKKEKIIQEAHRVVKEMRDQDQNRIAQLLRECAAAVEKKADPVSEIVAR